MDHPVEYVECATMPKDEDVKKWLASVGLEDKAVSLKRGDMDDNNVRLERR